MEYQNSEAELKLPLNSYAKFFQSLLEMSLI